MGAVYNKTYRRAASETQVMTAAAANGHGTEIDVSQYKNVGFVVVASGTATGTIKFKGSHSEIASVDFTAAVSTTNRWDYVGSDNYNSANVVVGDTGVVFTGAGATIIEQGEINTNTLRSLNVELAGYSAGTFSVYVYPTDNQ